MKLKSLLFANLNNNTTNGGGYLKANVDFYPRPIKVVCIAQKKGWERKSLNQSEMGMVRAALRMRSGKESGGHATASHYLH